MGMVKIEKHGNVSLITLDDGKVNVLNRESLSALSRALEDCKDAKAVVLTGGGKCFSAGLDLKLLPTLGKDELFDVLEQFSKVLVQILRYPRPIIAAVNGHAIAGGAVITLCCDAALAGEKDLKIGLSEVAVGMPLPKFVVELARNRLAAPRWSEAVLFGKLYNWQEAKEVGYLHQTVPSDQLLQTALAIAGQLAALPDSAYYPTKMSLWSHIPEQMEAAAVGAFLTDQARAHMSQFKG